MKAYELGGRVAFQQLIVARLILLSSFSART
jgi:hypothetical protein